MAPLDVAGKYTKEENWKRSGRSCGRSVSVINILKNIRMKCLADRDRES